MLGITLSPLDVGRTILPHQKVQSPPTLVSIKSPTGHTSEQNTLVGRRKGSREDLRPPDDGQHHVGTSVDKAQLLPLGGTVDINLVIPVPHIVDRHGLRPTLSVGQGQYTVLPLTQQPAGRCFVEQAVLPPHMTVVVLHFFFKYLFCTKQP